MWLRKASHTLEQLRRRTGRERAKSVSEREYSRIAVGFFTRATCKMCDTNQIPVPRATAYRYLLVGRSVAPPQS